MTRRRGMPILLSLGRRTARGLQRNQCEAATVTEGFADLAMRGSVLGERKRRKKCTLPINQSD